MKQRTKILKVALLKVALKLIRVQACNGVSFRGIANAKTILLLLFISNSFSFANIQTEDRLKETFRKPQKEFAVWVLNWTPRTEAKENLSSFLLTKTIGRLFLHSSILITDADFDMTSQINQHGDLDFDRERVKDYLSYPRYDDLENDIHAYQKRVGPNSTKEGGVVLEAFRVGFASEDRVQFYISELVEDGYKLSKENRALYDSFKNLRIQLAAKRVKTIDVVSIHKELKHNAKKTAHKLRAKYNIETTPNEIANMIMFGKSTKEYRKKWDRLHNNCAQIMLDALNLLFTNIEFNCDKDINTPFNVTRDCVIPHVKDPIYYAFISNGHGGILEIQHSTTMNEKDVQQIAKIGTLIFGTTLAGLLRIGKSQSLPRKKKQVRSKKKISIYPEINAPIY